MVSTSQTKVMQTQIDDLKAKKASYLGQNEVAQAINQNNEVLQNYTSMYGRTNMSKSKDKKMVVESRHQNIMRNMNAKPAVP